MKYMDDFFMRIVKEAYNAEQKNIYDDAVLVAYAAKLKAEEDMIKKAQSTKLPTDFNIIQKMLTSIEDSMKTAPDGIGTGAEGVAGSGSASAPGASGAVSPAGNEVAGHGNNTTQSGQAQSQAAQMSPDILSQLTSIKPFDSDNIDLRKINAFLDTYSINVGANDVAQSSINEAKNYMGKVTTLMHSPGMPIPMQNLSVDSMYSVVNPPPGSGPNQAIVPFLENLINMLVTAGRIYADFYNKNKEKLQGFGLANQVVSQFYGAQSPLNINISELRELQQQAISKLSGR